MSLILGPSLRIKALQFRPRCKGRFLGLIETLRRGYVTQEYRVPASCDILDQRSLGQVSYTHRVFEDKPRRLDGVLGSNQVGLRKVQIGLGPGNVNSCPGSDLKEALRLICKQLSTFDGLFSVLSPWPLIQDKGNTLV